MKKKIVIWIMVVCMCMTQTVMAAEFSDVPENHWAYDAISELVDRGIVNGMGDGTYHPDDTLTRAQFIKLLTCGLGDYDEATDYKPVFHDTYPDAWYTPYVSCGAAAGIVNAEEELFYPEAPMSRGDAAVWIVNGIGVEKDVACPFPDVSDAAQKKAVAIAQDLGIINGYEDGNFRPDNTLTRAEASALILRTIENRPMFGQLRPDAKNEIVMKDSVKIINIGEQNVIQKADAKQKSITFSKPDDTVQNLKKGDILYIPENEHTGEGIVKVTSAKNAGGDVVVGIGSPEISEVIESMDISAIVSPSAEYLAKSGYVSGISPAAEKKADKEDNKTKGELNIDAGASLSPEADWEDGKLVWKVPAKGNASSTFNLKTENYDDEDRKGVYASLDMSMDILLDVTLSGENFDADLNARAEVNSTIDAVAGFLASKETQQSIKLDPVEFQVSGPITVEVKPYIVATAGGTFDAKATATLTNSIGCELKDGAFTTWSDPKTNIEFQAEADGYLEIGPKMVADLGIRDFEFKAFGKEFEIDAPEILNFTATMGLGANGKVAIDQKAGASNDGGYYEGHQNTPDENGVIHHCYYCVSGNVYSYDQFSFGLSDDLNDFVEGIIKTRLTHESDKITFPFSPWYHSKGEWGTETELASCPHKLVRVSGQITEKDTGELISGASINAVSRSAYIDFAKENLAEDKHATTDSTGTYEMFLEPGGWNFAVSEKAHKGIERTVHVPEGKEITQNFVMELKDIEISGYVTNQKTGEPISGAEIVVGDVHAFSDANGYFVLEVKPKETYDISVVCNKFMAFASSVEVETNDVSLNISLEPDNKWQEAYRSILKNEGEYRYITLVDLDHDDIPELILSGIPGSGLFSGFEKGYSYKNGEVQQITADETFQVSFEYHRYIHNSTGEYRIEGAISIRGGWAYSGGSYGIFYIQNGELLYSPVRGWERDTTQVGKDYIETYTYHGYNSGNPYEISESEYNRIAETMHDGWTKDESFKQASAVFYKAIKNTEIDALYETYETSTPS